MKLIQKINTDNSPTLVILIYLRLARVRAASLLQHPVLGLARICKQKEWAEHTATLDRARSIPHAWPDPGIPNDLIGQRQFDEGIFEFLDAVPRKSSCVEKPTRRHRFANLLNDDDRKPKQRSRTTEQALGDSHEFMCDLEEQA